VGGRGLNRFARIASWLVLLLASLGLATSLAANLVTSDLVVPTQLAALLSFALGVLGVLGEVLTPVFGRLLRGHRVDSHAALEDAILPIPGSVRRSPNLLLVARYAAAPFAGRVVEREVLAGWIESRPETSIILVSGPGGSGKTRLVAEMCRAKEREGWIAGFLKPSASLTDLKTLSGSRKRVLLAIDYAETRLEEVITSIDAFANRPTSKAWKIVLIAREPGDWWRELPRRTHSMTAAATISGGVQLALGPTGSNPADRLQAFEASVREFGRVLDIAVDELIVPDLSTPTFDRPLFVEMAALSALFGPSRSRDQTPRDGPDMPNLIVDVLDREGRYWRESLLQAGLEVDDRIAGRAVAIATLTFAQNEDRAEQALAAIPELANPSEEATRRRLARWLHQLYPGEDSSWFRPIEPDLVGESHITRVLQEVPSLVTRLVAVLDREQLKQALTILTRSARSSSAVADALRAAIATNLDVTWEPLVAVAEETGEPAGKILAMAVATDPRPHVVVGLMRALPGSTVALRQVAVVTTSAAIDLAERQGGAGPREIAGLSDALSGRLSDVGRLEEALESAERAVELRRPLASPEPEFEAEFAASLNNLANRLSEVGRKAEALASSREAVGLYRTLATAEPNTYKPDLAMSLNNLANRLGDVGDRQASLRAGIEAREIRSELVATEPAKFEADLAMSLSNLANQFAAVGQRQEALASAEGALEIYRRLAIRRPDTFRAQVAGSLSSLSNRLSDLGRRDEALARGTESLAAYRSLAQEQPGAFLPEYAMALNNSSNRLGDLGLKVESLERIEEAVRIRRTLAAQRPEAFLPVLAESISNLSGRLADLGRHSEALDAGMEALLVRRTMWQSNPSLFAPDMAASLTNVSNQLVRAGRREEALIAALEAVSLYRTLASDSPAAFIPDLALSLTNLSERLFNQGRIKESLDATTESVGIFRNLAVEEPAAFRPQLAMSLNNLSNSLAALSEHDPALAAIQEAVSIYRDLVSAVPGAFEGYLAMSLTNLSRRLSSLGRGEEAAEAATEATRLRRNGQQ
jgi:tetratricopeptide (TPR) repeat protein